MIIDCDTCVVRGDACRDCVISVLLGAPPSVELDGSEQRAITALADAGLVPRLRLVAPQADRRPCAERSPDSAERGERQVG
ncbi:hypothetical protein F0L68_26350 [Solihabitans fulvus]|uniref:Uncharacterized protein n=1 Tax=Solihabitans fulvus TaxID=1892852 RepID=A0A5B2X1C7_9PSEU|nr:hypothetical protein [Solihabitans fulvus]KAA2256557.1 hypothetical protein F0L68_26350 [Solihabitans fulvus]